VPPILLHRPVENPGDIAGEDSVSIVQDAQCYQQKSAIILSFTVVHHRAKAFNIHGTRE